MTKSIRQYISAFLVSALFFSICPVISEAAEEKVGDWVVNYYNAEGSVVIDTKTAYEGESSLKIVNVTPRTSNRFIYISIPVDVKAGKEYYIGSMVKSQKTTYAAYMIDWGKRYILTPFGTDYDWMNYEMTYFAEETKKVNFQLLVDGTTEGLWIDNVIFIDSETGENLIKNSSFEQNAAKQEQADNLADKALENIYYDIISAPDYSAEDMEKVRGGFKYMPVYKQEGIVIDGNADDWENYPPLAMPTLSDQYQIYIHDNKKKDVQAECRFAYDEENFYMMIEVTDDEYYQMSGADFYWQGDSVQMTVSGTDESYGSEIGLSHNPETGMGEVYSPAISEEKLKKFNLKSNHDGNRTLYEISFPWSIKFEERPDEILFNILVNDNDGAGRRYCAELAPGISEGKTNLLFPKLEMMDSKQDWYAWIQGPRTGYTEEEYEFEYFIVNNGEEKKFRVKTDDGEEVIKVPENTGIRRKLIKKFSKAGNHSVGFEAEIDGENNVFSADINVDRKPASEEYAKKVLSENIAHEKEISGLLEKCGKKGINTDYEILNHRIIERFSKYLEDDINNKEFSNIYYTEETLSEIYTKTKASLEAYLNGEKTPLLSPKYITSDWKIDGQSIWATTELDGEEERRPVFFVGYGHFSSARNDIPVFKDWAVNTVQQEIGPTTAMDTVSVLGKWQSQVFIKPDFELSVDNETVHSGEAALKITYASNLRDNEFVTLTQTVAVEPGKTYELKCWAKADNAKRVWISPNHFDTPVQMGGTYDWKEYSTKYTVPENQTSVIVRIVCDNICDAFYLDDISYCEEGTDKNLLETGGFEPLKTDMDMIFNPDKEHFKNMVSALETAEENDIAVTVLLSPHYFPAELITKYNIEHTGGTNIDYDVNSPKAKEIIENYLNEVIPVLKDYKSLTSITLSNEPHFDAATCGDTYLPEWQEYLMERYNNDISYLNMAYQTKYNDFSEIDFDKNSNPAKIYDYNKFNDKVFARWHKWMAETIRKIAPDIPLHTKILGYAGDDRSNYTLFTNGTGYEQYHEFLDLNGCDYTNFYELNHIFPLRKELYYDYLTSMKDAPVVNSEDHVIRDQVEKFEPVIADYVAQDIYQGAIHGRAVSDIWMWERSYDRKQNAWASISFRPDAIAKVGRAALDLNRNAFEISALQREEREIGILYSDASILNDSNAMHAAYQAYSAAMFNGKRVQFIVESQINKMHGCKIVIVPATKYVTAETLPELKKFILNGGRVLILGTDSMKKSERNIDNDKEILDFIFENSDVLEYSGMSRAMAVPTEAELYAYLRNMLKEEGIYYVSVVDEMSGEPVDYVEYNIGVYDKKVLVNLLNFKEDRNVKIYINNKPVTNAINIIDDEKTGEVIELKKYIPVTLEIEADNCFFDTYGHWAEKDIMELSDLGIVSGITESRYMPQKTLSRAEFLALLVRGMDIDESPYRGEVPDVSDDKWYSGAVQKAIDANLIKRDENFRPEESITREEMCSLLVLCYEYENGEIKADDTEFKDIAEINDIKTVSKAVSLGLMVGMDDGTFSPIHTATRAEAASVVARYNRLKN